MIKSYNNSNIWEIVEKIFYSIRNPENKKFMKLLESEEGNTVLETLEIVEQYFYDILNQDTR